MDHLRYWQELAASPSPVGLVIKAVPASERKLSDKDRAALHAEDERIRESKKTPAAHRRHKFKAATWTFPNGHPRCLICGDEERTGGMCEGIFGGIEKATASGYPLDKRRKFQGLDISVENRKGTYRVDKKHDPPEWRTKMLCDYGYIRHTEGVDHDHVDCFVGPNEDAKNAYVIKQVNPKTGAFDEEKVMLGFDSPAAAKAMYLKHYDTPDYFGSMSAIPMDTFPARVMDTLGRGGDVIKALPDGWQDAPTALVLKALAGHKLAPGVSIPKPTIKHPPASLHAALAAHGAVFQGYDANGQAAYWHHDPTAVARIMKQHVHKRGGDVQLTHKASRTLKSEAPTNREQSLTYKHAATDTPHAVKVTNVRASLDARPMLHPGMEAAGHKASAALHAGNVKAFVKHAATHAKLAHSFVPSATAVAKHVAYHWGQKAAPHVAAIHNAVRGMGARSLAHGLGILKAQLSLFAHAPVGGKMRVGGAGSAHKGSHWAPGTRLVDAPPLHAVTPAPVVESEPSANHGDIVPPPPAQAAAPRGAVIVDGMTVEDMAAVAARHGHDYDSALAKIKARPSAWVGAVSTWKTAESAERQSKRRDTMAAKWKPTESQQAVLDIVGSGRRFASSILDMPMYSKYRAATKSLIKRGILDRTEGPEGVHYGLLKPAAPETAPVKQPHEMTRDEFLGPGTRAYKGLTKVDWKTGEPITTVDATQHGKRAAGYFSDRRDVAQRFADLFEPGSHHVAEATVNMQHPFMIDAKGAPASQFMVDALDPKHNNPQLVEALESPDYDGIIIRNTSDEGTIHLPKHPAQIRADITHRAAVEAALKDGKTVPPEVLADYPDLEQHPAPRPLTPAAAEQAGAEAYHSGLGVAPMLNPAFIDKVHGQPGENAPHLKAYIKGWTNASMAAPEREDDEARHARIKATPNMERSPEDVEWANNYSRGKVRAAQEAAAQQAEAAKANSPVAGFLAQYEGKSKGQAEKALAGKMRRKGVPVARSAMIEQDIKEGAKVMRSAKGERRLGTWEWYLSEGQIGKIAMDYAEYLASQPAPISKATPTDARAIGDKLGIDWNTIPLAQFARGLEVESEHADVTGGDPLATGKIALAHLKERPDYYTMLEKVEDAPISKALPADWRDRPVALIFAVS